MDAAHELHKNAFLNHEMVLRTNVFRQFVKRGLDVAASLFGLIVLSPLFLVISIVIRLESPGKAIFVQKRNGLHGREFRMYKFRTMHKDADKLRAALDAQNELDGPAFKMTNDPRVTKVGKFLRKTSLDELPQLLNVLSGSMSIVGPRPLPTYETEKLSNLHRRRLLAVPGLICYWQISGRNDVNFDEWMEMDFRYIKEAGIRTDLKIIAKAVPAVLFGKGAY
jgi:lipopolysaccharide/colanic/teichoic acid biosynthesis glycosyltransferase